MKHQVCNSQSKATPTLKQSNFCRKTFFFKSNMNLGSKSVLTVLCSSVTLLMIYQLLLTFIVDKPTTTTKLEKQIEISDLPEVVVCILCMTPGFNSSLRLPERHLLQGGVTADKVDRRLCWMEWRNPGEII